MKKRLTLLAFLLALLVAPGALSEAAAQDEDPSASRADTFQAAEGPNTENIPGGGLMVGAYGTVFALVLGYVVSIGFRQAGTQRELDALRAELDAGRSDDPKS